MTNPDLQPGKPVQTRSGLEAVIYAVHEGQAFPILGAYKNSAGDWVPFKVRADGSVYTNGDTDRRDIIPAPKKLTGFINVYPCTVYETREEAGRAADDSWPGHRIDCIDLASLNLTEGHGLTEGV